MYKSTVFLLFSIIATLLISTPISGQYQKPRVLFTTPQGYAQRMVAALEDIDIFPVSLPLIETVNPDNPSQIKALINNPDKYQWIAFSSRKAIEVFAQYLKDMNCSVNQFKHIQFCAIGKDAKHMYNLTGITPSIIPLEPSPVGIVDALAQIKDIKGQKIAVLAPKVENLTEPNVVPDFLFKLDSIGLEVTKIEAYITRSCDVPNKRMITKEITRGEYDIIAFTSTAEAEAFLSLMKGKKIPDTQVFACFGPYTAANVKKMGFNVSIVSDDFSSFNGFAKVLKLWLVPQKGTDYFR